jgi:ABC-type phosphate/phosphonate transport system permease subunit
MTLICYCIICSYVRSLKSFNASKIQIISFAAIPQIIQSFVANNLYIR